MPLFGDVLVLGPALFVLTLAALFASFRPHAFLFILLCAFVLANFRTGLLTGEDQGLVSIGTNAIYPLDVTIIICLASIAILLVHGGLKGIPPLMFVFVGGVVLGTAFGIRTLGLEAGISSWRAWLTPSVWLVWSYLALRRDPQKSMSMFVGGGLVASAFQMYGFATTGFGSASTSTSLNGVTIDIRPIHSLAALLIAAALIIVVARAERFQLRTILLVGWLSLSVLLSQHRSVWVATLVGLFMVMLIRTKHSRTRPVTITMFSVAALVVGSAVWYATSRSVALSESASDTSTWNYRVQLWIERLAQPRPAYRWAFGDTFSPTPEADAFRLAISSHNMVLDATFALGLVGLIAVIAVWVTTFARCPDALSVSVRPVLVAVLVYGFAYAWPYWIWLVMGLTLGVARRDDRRLSARDGEMRRARNRGRWSGWEPSPPKDPYREPTLARVDMT